MAATPIPLRRRLIDAGAMGGQDKIDLLRQLLISQGVALTTAAITETVKVVMKWRGRGRHT